MVLFITTVRLLSLLLPGEDMEHLLLLQCSMECHLCIHQQPRLHTRLIRKLTRCTLVEVPLPTRPLHP